jgi:hypothetical protein
MLSGWRVSTAESCVASADAAVTAPVAAAVNCCGGLGHSARQHAIPTQGVLTHHDLTDAAAVT